jgi:hypothetical protein
MQVTQIRFLAPGTYTFEVSCNDGAGDIELRNINTAHRQSAGNRAGSLGPDSVRPEGPPYDHLLDGSRLPTDDPASASQVVAAGSF